MKAIVFKEYGEPDVLHIEEVVIPAPKENEVLIRIHAASVNFGDVFARNFKAVSPREFNMPLLFWLMMKLSFGVNKPKTTILGSEFAGEIEATGKTVTRFKPDDPVYGYVAQSMGAYAEYLCMPENRLLALKPANLTYEEAAVIPYGAIMASNLLRHVDLRPGKKILINGASGGIGSMAVQLARHAGAEVTGVCGTPRLEFVKTLGASQVIDYTKEDFTRNGETYDVIFDILGKTSFAKCKGSLKENGCYLRASFKTDELLQMLWTSLTGGKKVICALASEKAEDLDIVRRLIETGKVKAIVDKCYPMNQADEAHRYVEDGHKKGNVVIAMG
jgi:NADPH:quinone reductase-like Zn-dependent oxidoreductase